jgi:osmotically inducible lipoprotein OsmB
MQNFYKTLSLILLSITLAGCGQTKGERALSGAAIGAGVGAVGAEVTGGNAGTGAIVGGAVGAGTGILME